MAELYEMAPEITAGMLLHNWFQPCCMHIQPMDLLSPGPSSSEDLSAAGFGGNYLKKCKSAGGFT